MAWAFLRVRHLNQYFVARADTLQDIANLNIDDGPGDPFAAYDQEPPPAPKLKSKGVVAMDITDEFTKAAKREFMVLYPESIITC